MKYQPLRIGNLVAKKPIIQGGMGIGISLGNLAGGITDAADAKHAFDLGVDALQIASRFVTTEECDADIRFKESYLHANEEGRYRDCTKSGWYAWASNFKPIYGKNHGRKKTVTDKMSEMFEKL